MSQAASGGIHAENVAHDVNAHVKSDRRLEKTDLDRVYAPIVTDLKVVEAILQSELHSETPWVDQLLEHNWLNGGKRIRPVLLLLAGASRGPLLPDHHQLAAAVEMIHAATLVHDDVLDDAETRRHQPTVNSQWGNRVSVLLGDYLFTHAFDLASRVTSIEAIRILAKASNRVCEGEMRQNASQGDLQLSEEEYLSIISCKTAHLCGCSSRLGALISGANESETQGFADYGHNLGIAFQIIDDVLDLVGQQNRVGKTLGTDFLNRKLTLPLIHCLKHLPEAERTQLVERLQGQSQEVGQILPFLEQTDSLRYARRVAHDHARRALRFATNLDSEPYSECLQLLADFVLDRTH